MIGSSSFFIPIFDNDSSDRKQVISRALKSGFYLVINDPNRATPMCILAARALRLADEAAGNDFRDNGQITAADKAKHECGLAHVLGPDDHGKISALINRLGNTVNIGVHLGLSGYVVINYDSDEQKEAFISIWNQQEDTPLSICTIRTPGTKIVSQGNDVWTHLNGGHFYFKIQPGQILSDSISEFTAPKGGWKAMWGNSQTLVPPIRKEGAAYVLQSAPLDLPDWLAQLINLKAAEAELFPLAKVPVVPAGQRSAFSKAAAEYRKNGWNPFPIVLDGAKYKPYRVGHTGKKGKDLSDDEITEYSNYAYDFNIALRMQKGLIAIDVDGYDDKDGKDTLFNLEYSLGALPPTFRNTARLDDKVSGHRFYRVPEELEFLTQIPNKNIEILQNHHRYANVWPSKNPKTLLRYRWYDLEGILRDEGFIPNVEDIPLLPQAWVEYLTKHPREKVAALIDPEDMTDHMVEDGRALALRSVNKLKYVAAGTRNNQLNTTSFQLGTLVAAQIITVEEAEEWVIDACEENGLLAESQSEVQATFNSGMNAGIDNPWSPKGLTLIDPEPIIEADHEKAELNNVAALINKNLKPSILEVSTVAQEVIRICKKNGFTKGQTVSWLHGWSSWAGFTYNSDQISIDICRTWDLITVPTMIAKDAKRVIRKSKFLWEGRIPLGGLTFLAGEGESGKTTLTAWIVAGITRGTVPGSMLGVPRNVLYVRPEGSFDEVLTQFMAVDADLDRIKEIVMAMPGGTEQPPTLPDDIPGFQEMCELYDPVLVVFDPLPARMNSRLSPNDQNAVRQALEPLTHLLQKRQMSCLGIHHFSKFEDTAAKSRMLGSVAFTNIARSVLLVVHYPETNERFIGVAKANNVDKNQVHSISFRIVESDEFEAETDSGIEMIMGTKIELVATDPRSIDRIIYELAAKTKAMRERGGRTEPTEGASSQS